MWAIPSSCVQYIRTLYYNQIQLIIMYSIRESDVQRFAKWLSRLSFGSRLTSELWRNFGALSRYHREDATRIQSRSQVEDCVELLLQEHVLCSETFFVSVRTVASSQRYLLSAPKWGQDSEVNHESNDNRNNHFANRCTQSTYCAHYYIHSYTCILWWLCYNDSTLSRASCFLLHGAQGWGKY